MLALGGGVVGGFGFPVENVHRLSRRTGRRLISAPAVPPYAR